MAMQSTLKSCHRSGPIINTPFKFNKALMQVYSTVDYPLPEVLVGKKKLQVTVTKWDPDFTECAYSAQKVSPKVNK